MIRSQIQFTEEQIIALRELAAREKRSIADVVRECVDQRLAQSQPNDRAALIAKAKKAMGYFASGKSDVSSRHDAYLAEDFL